MKIFNLKTENGDIAITSLSEKLLKILQTKMTYGFMPFKKDFNGAKYGFVVKCDGKEIPCIKQQPIDYNQETALKLISLHNYLILETYCRLSRQNLDMVYYAVPYLKQKGDDSYESGVAHFIFPGDIDCQGDSSLAFDDLGEGATFLLKAFMNEFNNIKGEKYPIPYIGLDVRTRSQLGSILSGFMLCKDTIIYHGAKVQEEDPRFGILVRNGIKSVVHAPSLPMEITNEQLNESKGF